MTARRTTISIFGKDYPIPPKGLYAGVPGQGPEGKECRHCEHRQVAEYSRRFSKCRLMSDHWTHGAKTDIQATAPACEKFKDNDLGNRRADSGASELTDGLCGNGNYNERTDK